MRRSLHNIHYRRHIEWTVRLFRWGSGLSIGPRAGDPTAATLHQIRTQRRSFMTTAPIIDCEDPRPEAERDLETGRFWIHLTETQAAMCASGYVPASVKSVLRELLDYALEDERRAARPVPRKTAPRRKRSRP